MMTEPAFDESIALSSDAFPAPERFEMKVRPLPGGINVTQTEITPCS